VKGKSPITNLPIINQAVKGLHQQLGGLCRQIAADQATVDQDQESWRTPTADMVAAHQAKERLPRLRDEAAKLETDIELGEAAHHQLTVALSNLLTIAAGGRELALAITAAETAQWRLRQHLGKQP
jgi:hypothetical protein